MTISKHIEDQIGQLAQSVNCFAGVSPFIRDVPSNIVLFSRHLASEFKPSRDLHDRFLLVMCIRSKGAIIVDDGLFVLTPGDSLLVFPHQSHHYAKFETKSICWLFIGFEIRDPDSLATLKDSVVRLSAPAYERIGWILDCACAKKEDKVFAANELAHWLVLLLTSLLREATRRGRGRRGVLGLPGWRATLVRRVCEYMASNRKRRFSETDVARHAGLSESHLRRLFRQATGISLGTYMRQTRIDNACRLLHLFDLNVGEVAEQCGFASQFSFSRTFRRLTGQSPSRYRAMIRSRELGT